MGIRFLLIAFIPSEVPIESFATSVFYLLKFQAHLPFNLPIFYALVTGKASEIGLGVRFSDTLKTRGTLHPLIGFCGERDCCCSQACIKL